LWEKLIADLTAGEKIMVFRQNEPLLANDLNDLRQAIAAYGPSVLLWVQAARAGHPAGSVEVIEDRLMTGYVTTIAPRTNVPDLDIPSWMAMLRIAHKQRPHPAVAPADMAPPVAPKQIKIIFGSDGNAAAYMGEGWSGQENGYCWSIDDRSILRIPALAAADSYRLEMDVNPFVAPPALLHQRLRVLVNGDMVQSLDLLSRGKATFAFAGAPLLGADEIELLFEHPDAASPQQITGRPDGRRLAVAFRRLLVKTAP